MQHSHSPKIQRRHPASGIRHPDQPSKQIKVPITSPTRHAPKIFSPHNDIHQPSMHSMPHNQHTAQKTNVSFAMHNYPLLLKTWLM
ncbi:hypothetical protein B398_08440 [Xylella fastidiosa 32]|nr:hypothetical protein B398_08440 [Xylella fastidiosa 32]